MSVETMWSDRDWFIKRNQNDDFRMSIDQLQELRTALAILRSRVDGNAPLAFVGHDFGAMYGVVLGALEPSFSSYILMAGTPRFADWYFYYPPIDEAERGPYLAKMSAIDPISHVGRLTPAPVLFQFGLDDPHVPEERGQAFFAAAKEPKEIRWYGGGHGLDEQARDDRLAWLISRLELT